MLTVLVALSIVSGTLTYEQLETDLNRGVDACQVCESDDLDAVEFCDEECS